MRRERTHNPDGSMTLRQVYFVLGEARAQTSKVLLQNMDSPEERKHFLRIACRQLNDFMRLDQARAQGAQTRWLSVVEIQAALENHPIARELKAPIFERDPPRGAHFDVHAAWEGKPLAFEFVERTTYADRIVYFFRGVA